jgi:hypothetical protein
MEFITTVPTYYDDVVGGDDQDIERPTFDKAKGSRRPSSKVQFGVINHYYN